MLNCTKTMLLYHASIKNTIQTLLEMTCSYLQKENRMKLGRIKSIPFSIQYMSAFILFSKDFIYGFSTASVRTSLNSFALSVL